MGLDMYLMRFPRYKGYGPRDIEHVDDFLGYLEDEKVKNLYSVEEWCGVKKDDLPSDEDIEFLKKYRTEKFPAWDDEKKYSHKRISDNVAYWRKANAIHRWFVENIQCGVDDCDYHREVRKSDVEELRDICEQVIMGSVLIKGKIGAGQRLENGRWETIYEDGLKILNPELCDELLPSTSGFFFGSTDYDQWYIDDVKYTYEVLGKILDETDFKNQMLYYSSSW